MPRDKRRRKNVQRPGTNSRSASSRERQKPIGKVLLAVIGITMVIGFVYYSQSTGSNYPQNIAGVTYPNPSVSPGGAKVSLPSSFVSEKKLVFFDLKLKNQTGTLTYLGRTIPLSAYRNGEYLPLIVISTPTQKVFTGIRVCEPCGSFSFHAVDGKYLVCDACGTRWDLETMMGVSGGCVNFPPPRLSAQTGSNVDIDLTSIGLNIA